MGNNKTSPKSMDPLTIVSPVILIYSLFRLESWYCEKIKFDTQNINKIRVVPNPYYSAHAYEAPLAPGITSGRGQRRIIFTNVPSDGVLSIFTVRGQHVITLEHEGDIMNCTIEWNLRSKENLDISYGVYFFVMESKIFKSQSGKFAIIKW